MSSIFKPTGFSFNFPNFCFLSKKVLNPFPFFSFMVNPNETVYGEYFHQMKSGQKFFTRFLSCPHNQDVSMKIILLHPFPFSSRIFEKFYQSFEARDIVNSACKMDLHLQMFFLQIENETL